MKKVKKQQSNSSDGDGEYNTNSKRYLHQVIPTLTATPSDSKPSKSKTK